ncbi:hypothetical protein [Shewanella sp. KCT]|uniref:hypothetical protein n=1 Tax=Shewanella sp. KCT TaxID=2569535 RepID=UPI0011837D3C|nr:hypothetical protein [Shewanella sp. KCT]TVP12293.1 hypothetical protein AYI87_14785 [Shewanella sp. KCT]
MRKIQKLSDLQFKCSQEEVLHYLHRGDKSILVKVPPNRQVWCALKAPNKLIERGYGRCRFFAEGIRDPEVDKSLSVFKTLKLEHVFYIEIKSNVVVDNLIIDDVFIVKDFESIIMSDDGGSLFKLSSAKARSLFEGSIDRDKRKCGLYEENKAVHISILFFMSVCEFFLVEKSAGVILNDTSVLDFLSSIEVGRDSVFVYFEDVKSLIVEELDKIPFESPYFIPPELRGLTDVDNLALIGNRIFGDNFTKCIKTKELKGIIEKELGFSNSKAESAAFFLVSKPHHNAMKGKSESCEQYKYSEIPNDLAPDCQFPYLVEALRIDHASTKCEKRKKLSGRDFLCGAGFSFEKLDHALMFIKEK